MLSNATSLGTFELTGKGIGPFEFTSPALDAFVRGNALDDLLTFAIVRNTPQNGPGGVGDSYAHAAASREHSAFAGPRLTLERVPIPEPCTVALFGVGALCLSRRKRRRRV